jgi:trehalose/maltose hydrolase-like predicted phosphorylase
VKPAVATFRTKPGVAVGPTGYAYDLPSILSRSRSRLPEVTRGLLYCYRRLEDARAAAKQAGFAGAMFPWQSGSGGSEETRRLDLSPLTWRWEPDRSRNQRHVNAAIFYNVWHYFQATQDLPFLHYYGAEMMLEIACFWGSIAHFNPERGRYEIRGVMGPDEFHEQYPGAQEGASQQRLHRSNGGVGVRAGLRGALAAAN